MNPIFVSCPKGIESLLREEVLSLGLQDVTETTGGVIGSADAETLYRLCLWSRLASRILLTLVEAPATTMEQLADHVQSIDWSQHMRASGTMRVNFAGTLKDVNNELFGAMRVKDVIVDQFRDNNGVRPSVAKNDPDITVDVRIRKGSARVAIDISGEPLHRRGYRLDGAQAPLKENLAAAILIRAGWPAVAEKMGALIDPMCGSGTLLIEAAWMAGDRAPGLSRRYWGFTGWTQHDPAMWITLTAEARARRAAGEDKIPPILGYDADAGAVQASLHNIDRAGVKGSVWAYRKELSQWQKPTHVALNDGLLVCNPPYGQRLGEEQALIGLYRYLGQVMGRELQGWQASVFTGNPELAKAIGYRAHKFYRLNNGPIDCKLFNFEITDTWKMRSQDNSISEADHNEAAFEKLSDGARMVANRIRKNLKSLKNDIKREQWQAFRIYDADIPEYSAAVDRYNDWLHVSEYTAPREIPEEKTKARLADLMAALPVATGVSAEKIVLKERSRQKGQSQYNRLSQVGQEFPVVEGGVNLLVNMTDYLDTGLFLDHRPVRMQLAEMAKGKSFLNLYCYTAAATVHAAVGGAKSSVSVDLSNTYIQWAKRNFDANGMTEGKHKLVAADCRAWMKDYKNRDVLFDVIFMDPPTFSNSKKTHETLDIQRDHAELIALAMKHLEVGGQLVFSNNRRGFKLDDAVLEQYVVKDISARSIPKDFKRNQKIHQCWILSPRD
jgi:23S rRNA (guanine2445-N2)-methyltransferase / 23S rRNA (guanine2069-N7)-methyltransferase